MKALSHLHFLSFSMYFLSLVSCIRCFINTSLRAK